MSGQDIRWIQRLRSFSKAFGQLRAAVQLAGQRRLSRLEEQGMIQAFEFTHEQAWNTLKDFMEDRGTKKLYGSKDVTREAFRLGLIEDGEIWMKMVESRNLTSHTYDETTAAQIASAVVDTYFAEFELLLEKMEKIEADESE